MLLGTEHLKMRLQGHGRFRANTYGGRFWDWVSEDRGAAVLRTGGVGRVARASKGIKRTGFRVAGLGFRAGVLLC